MTSTELATSQGGALSLGPNQTNWTPRQLAVVKAMGADGASEAELEVFLHVCQRRGLDPFAKQIYAIVRPTWNPRTNRKEPRMTIQTGIDGFRLTASRDNPLTGKPTLYEGTVGPFWCGADGIWREVWLDAENPPVAARVGVWKKGYRSETWGVAHYAEYVQTKQNGEPVDMWKRMPANQLAKCAEAAAIRKAFPEDLSGIYIPEEMGAEDRAMQAEMTIDAEQDAPAGPRLPEQTDQEQEIAEEVATIDHRWNNEPLTLEALLLMSSRLRELYTTAASAKLDRVVAKVQLLGRNVSLRVKELEAEQAATQTAQAEPAVAEENGPVSDTADADAEAELAQGVTGDDDAVDAELVEPDSSEQGN